MHGRKARRVATASVLCALVVAAFEGTVVTSAMPTIARDLGGMEVYSWVFSAFLLASTVGVLTCGKLADSFGRRPVFVAGVALFLAGSALCGASMTVGQLITFRVVQGLGAGAIQPIAMTIGADLYTLAERAAIQAVFTSAWGIANVLGPVIGGFIVLHGSWRWVFLVNVPPGLLAVVLLLLSYRDPPRDSARPAIGSALFAGGAIALLLFALEPATVPPALRAPLTAAALLGVVAFVAHQRRTAQPLLPPSLLSHVVVRAGLVAGVFSGATLYLCAAYVPLWMTTHAHLDALHAGAALVPLLAGWAIGSSFGVRVLVAHGMRASVAGGFAIAFAGALALAVIGAGDLPVSWVYGALALLGVGLGPASSTALIGPQSAAPWRQRGVVTSAIYATRMLGGSLAVAAFGAPQTSGESRLDGIAAVTLGAAAVAWFTAPRGASAVASAVAEPSA